VGYSNNFVSWISTIEELIMGLRIYLEGERGEKIASVNDPHHLLRKLIKEGDVSNMCCLRFIDPYGNTTFNRLQIPQFLMELEILHRFIKGTEQSALISKIEEFAHRCAQEPHLYLKIYGD